jgi:hypothetical protein
MNVPAKVLTSYLQEPNAVEQMEIAVALIESAHVVQVITNEEEAAKVSEYRHQCNKAGRSLDALRMDVSAGARQVVANINGEFNPRIAKLKEEADNAGIKVTNYLIKKEKAAREAEEAKAKDEIEMAKQGVAVAREEVDVLTRKPEKPGEVTGMMGSKTGLRDHWTWKIVDISKVPEEYLVDPAKRVLRSKLNSEASGRKENASVPGIEFYNEKTISSRG